MLRFVVRRLILLVPILVGLSILVFLWIRALPATIELTVAALLFAVLLGIPLGFVAAKRYGTWVDHTSLVTSLIGVSIPIFFLAIILKYIFAVKLGLLPTVGRISVLIDIPHPTNFYTLGARPHGIRLRFPRNGDLAGPGDHLARLSDPAGRAPLRLDRFRARDPAR